MRGGIPEGTVRCYSVICEQQSVLISQFRNFCLKSLKLEFPG